MAKERVVIVGGGFGGAFTAKYLRRYVSRETEIELINSTNYFVFQPLLPEVASGTISAPDAVTPLRYMLPGVRVRMAEVNGIDLQKREVSFLQGSRRVPQVVEYDHLVIAVGQRTNLTSVPGLREHGLCMRDLADAHELRNHVIQCLEHADVTGDVDLKRRLLTFVVAGGGFSGVETIGEIAEMIRRTLKFYPNIGADDIRAVLVQRGSRILPELSASLSAYTLHELNKRGIQVMLNVSIKSVTATAVYLDDDSLIGTHTLVTTVGNGPRPLTEKLGIPLAQGKIPVDEYLRAVGTKHVWCLGDAALIPLGDQNTEDSLYAPPTAQFAVREARCVARNIAASQTGSQLKPFHFQPKGSLASIGNYKAVAEVLGLRLSGLSAWLLWRGLYIGMLPGFSTRLRVALNWLFDYFLPRSIVQIANQKQAATDYRCYAKDDVVFRPGQNVDGLYSIISGQLEWRVPGNNASESFVRMLGPGDHWGERILSTETQTQGTLIAMEDTCVLVLGRSDFANLRAAFPVVDDYFKTMEENIYAPSMRGGFTDQSENINPGNADSCGHVLTKEQSIQD